MEIFGIGLPELGVIFVLLLIFVGPAKLPEVASQLGKAFREFQKASNELTQAISAEIAAAEAEKAAVAAAQEAVLNTPATTDILSEAEAIAAEAERSYVEPASSTPESEVVPEPSQPATQDEPLSAPTAAPAPAAVVPPFVVPPGMEPLPQSLLTPSNASVAELVAPLVPAVPAAPAEDEAVVSSPAPVAQPPLRPVAFDLDPLPASLLTPSNASIAELVASLPITASAEPQRVVEPQLAGAESTSAAGLPPLPAALLLPSAEAPVLGLPAHVASSIGVPPAVRLALPADLAVGVASVTGG